MHGLRGFDICQKYYTTILRQNSAYASKYQNRERVTPVGSYKKVLPINIYFNAIIFMSKYLQNLQYLPKYVLC